eukprot:scaffold859_cov234-Ochromonas_danica.AAC.8
MSRLVFREESFIDHNNKGDELSPQPVSTRPSRRQYSSSYDVFGIDNDESAVGVSVGRSRPEGEQDNGEEEDEVEEDDEEEEDGEISNDNDPINTTSASSTTSSSNDKKKKKKKKKKAKKATTPPPPLLPAAVTAVSIPTAITVSTKSAEVEAAITDSSNSAEMGEAPPLSAFLQRFLSTKRDCSSAIPEPEPLEYTSDVYLTTFHAGMQEDSSSRSSSESEGEDSDRDGEETGELKHVIIDESAESLFEAENYLEPPTMAITIYNLPYVATEDDVRKVLRKVGIRIKAVTLGQEDRKKGGLLPGMALLEALACPAASNATTIINLIQGLEVGGRVLRASISGEKKRLSLDSGRYFDENISCKCQNCGQVGHLAVDCLNPTLPMPCHLCAGCDHDPSSCLNLICYRCGGFGHHSKACVMQAVARLQRPMSCYYCGSTRHDHTNCPNYNSIGHGDDNKTLNSPWIRCMVCYQQGHAICGPSSTNVGSQPQPQQQQHKDIVYIDCDNDNKRLFCPNCGEEVWRELEKFDGYDLNNLYRKILRSGSETYLFPSLMSQRRNILYKPPRGQEGRDGGGGRSKVQQQQHQRHSYGGGPSSSAGVSNGDHHQQHHGRNVSFVNDRNKGGRRFDDDYDYGGDDRYDHRGGRHSYGGNGGYRQEQQDYQTRRRSAPFPSDERSDDGGSNRRYQKRRFS